MICIKNVLIITPWMWLKAIFESYLNIIYYNYNYYYGYVYRIGAHRPYLVGYRCHNVLSRPVSHLYSSRHWSGPFFFFFLFTSVYLYYNNNIIIITVRTGCGPTCRLTSVTRRTVRILYGIMRYANQNSLRCVYNRTLSRHRKRNEISPKPTGEPPSRGDTVIRVVYT